MISRFLAAGALLAAACAPSGPPRERPSPMSGFGGGLNVPERIVAPSVPTLEGFPQAVRVGLAVYVSGMVPVDSAGEIVGPGDLAAQTRQATANLLAVVKAARGLPGDLVRVTAYVRNATADRVAMVRRELLKDLDSNAPPALTVVGMASLPEPAMEVLVDGVAQLRSEYPDRTRMGQTERR